MDIALLNSYRARIQAELRRNILPFWMEHAVDHTRGTFFGSVTNDLVPDRDVTRGALLTSRILWTFAAAHLRHPDPAYREMADFAYADLIGRFFDRRHGGLFWSLDGSDRPLEPRKQIYGQAFGIYALTEYHRATGRREPLDQAIAIHRLIETHARDPKQGGYLEARARDWQPIADVRLSPVDLNEPKSQNTHLHVMEAYTNLLRVWPDAELRRRQAELVDVMLTRILNPATHHLGLFFAEDWTLRCPKVSYGHDIEASWLLTEAANVVGDSTLRERTAAAALGIAATTLAEGIDADGAVFNEGGPQGVTNTNKEWWPQAEAVVGFLNADELGGGERFLDAALRAWDFIDRRLIDRKNGEWFRGVTRDGAVLQDELKVGFWKCPYHNGRACLEATARLQAIADRAGASESRPTRAAVA
jgi:mannobiose 2-epimerase